MNIAAILSNADYEQPRTADELHKWWFAKHEEYGATKEGRIYCREGRGLSKKFYEEAQPLLAYMRAYMSDSSLRCTLSAGSDRADAVLLDKADRIVKSIQITYAIDGYTEHLRMKELTKSGGVDALSKPLLSGDGKSRSIVFPTGQMTAHNDVVAEIIALITQRVAAKSTKGYGEGFTLIVGLIDGVLDPEDIAEFGLAYHALKHTFSELFFVGVFGRVLIPEKQSAKRNAPPTFAPRGCLLESPVT